MGKMNRLSRYTYAAGFTVSEWSSMGLTDASDSRLALLTRWIMHDLGFAGSALEVASADASFRRYFRLTRGEDSYIVMDAPPDKEPLGPFLAVARMMLDMDLNVPVVLAQERAQGFLLLSDLGTRQYLTELEAGRNVEGLYEAALAALVTLQTRGRDAAQQLGPYDRAALEREMALLPEWFLRRHLELAPQAGEHEMLEQVFDELVRSALEQPASFVHRDYHSRNLLVGDDAGPGILDFQDAVRGPITYDLVSLLKDCYIAWPRERVLAWALDHRARLEAAGLATGADDARFIRWFDLMGLQRHIKVLGIFARLYHRDGKSGYLKDLPRVLRYVEEAAALYPETAAFAAFIAARIRPAFAAAQRRHGAPADAGA